MYTGKKGFQLHILILNRPIELSATGENTVSHKNTLSHKKDNKVQTAKYIHCVETDSHNIHCANPGEL